MWQKRYQIICHFTITCSSALGEEVFNAVITAVLHWVQSAPWQSPRFCGFCCVQVVFEETDKHGQDRVILLPKDTRYLFHTLYVSGEEALLFHFGKPSHSAVSCSVQFFGFRRTAFDGFFSPFTDPWSGLAVSESVCFILEILPCMTPYSPAFFCCINNWIQQLFLLFERAIKFADILIYHVCVGTGNASRQFALAFFRFRVMYNHMDWSTCSCDTTHLLRYFNLWERICPLLQIYIVCFLT